MLDGGFLRSSTACDVYLFGIPGRQLPSLGTLDTRADLVCRHGQGTT